MTAARARARQLLPRGALLLVLLTAAGLLLAGSRSHRWWLRPG